MRSRLILLAIAGLLTAITAGVTSLASAAKPIGLTISVAPNPSTAGEPLAITGHLNAADDAGKSVVLWHRVAGHGRFTRVQSTTTDSSGNYSFQRSLGVVDTNRDWYVTSLGSRSPVWHQKVYAAITLAESTATALTNHVVTFSGHVAPSHRGDRVFLQSQVGSEGDDWTTIDSGRVGFASNYRIAHRFRVQDLGGKTLRVLFRGDRRNIRSTSNSVDLTVTQAQNPSLTIAASPSQVVTVGGSVTLAGNGPANTTVDLYARPFNRGSYAKVASTTSSAAGAYSFTASDLQRNTVYQVRTASLRSAQLFVRVKDAVTITASSPTVAVGGTGTFSGTVTPSKTGHVIYLQELGSDGDWHLLQVGRIGPNSQYSFTQLFTAAGTAQLRAFIPGGPVNGGAASAPATVTVG